MPYTQVRVRQVADQHFCILCGNVFQVARAHFSAIGKQSLLQALTEAIDQVGLISPHLPGERFR